MYRQGTCGNKGDLLIGLLYFAGCVHGNEFTGF